MKLNKAEQIALKKAAIDLIKISLFIGFIPSLIALIVDLRHLDFELNKLTPNTSLTTLHEMMNVIIPNNDLYINILAAYVFAQILLLLIVFIKIHTKRSVNQKILRTCQFFSPIAEVLFQLLAIVSGFFITLFLLSALIIGFMQSIKYLLTAILILVVAIPIVMINIVIMQNYVEKKEDSNSEK